MNLLEVSIAKMYIPRLRRRTYKRKRRILNTPKARPPLPKSQGFKFFQQLMDTLPDLRIALPQVPTSWA